MGGSETHRFDPDRKIWVRTKEYYRQQRLEMLLKDPLLKAAKRASSTALDAGRGKTVWVFASMDDAIRHMRRDVEMWEDNRTYKAISAYDLVLDFLNPDVQQKHSALNPDILYILAGYNDPPNRQLGNLVAYTLTQRVTKKKPTWLFTPGDPQRMDKIWGAETSGVLTSIIPYQKNLLSGNPVVVEGFTSL